MVKLYVEGGGDYDFLRAKCRQGFNEFLQKAGFKGNMPRIVACGGRANAFDRFTTALSQGETAFLLLDSEDLVLVSSPWEHLRLRTGDKFEKPPAARDDQCHLMVVCMEAWFLADKPLLVTFFGQGFNGNVLPARKDIEQISKSELFTALARATKTCKTKAPYDKGEHSFDLLGRIDPAVVRKASPWADRFINALATAMQIA